MKRKNLLIMAMIGMAFSMVSCSDDDDKCVKKSWFADKDSDGFGDPNVTIMACEKPEGYVDDNTDCNDEDESINTSQSQSWYRDADADGYGNPDDSKSASTCAQPTGYVADNTDCNDADESIYPGAVDAPNDGIDSDCDGTEEVTIWTGENMTFTKAGNSDWTLAANQDKLTDKVTFTRQDAGQIYNYQWWQDTFGADATYDDLYGDFWNDGGTKEFTATGGTKGVRWAILDDTGADSPWDADFNLYGTLGDPTHFYSFNNIASMIKELNEGDNVIAVVDDFYISTENNASTNGTRMPELVGKKLGVWLVDEDIYLTFTFTEWGSNGSGGALSYIRSTK